MRSLASCTRAPSLRALVHVLYVLPRSVRLFTSCTRYLALCDRSRPARAPSLRALVRALRRNSPHLRARFPALKLRFPCSPFFLETHQHREHPRVPGYAEIDRNDPAALIEARHQEARDKWVAIMGTRLLREQLRECYMREGTNHLKNCRELAQEYVHRIKDASNAYQTWDKQVRGCPCSHRRGPRTPSLLFGVRPLPLENSHWKPCARLWGAICFTEPPVPITEHTRGFTSRRARPRIHSLRPPPPFHPALALSMDAYDLFERSDSCRVRTGCLIQSLVLLR